ncbi:hypothetical protein [Crateriforma conspicua]|uniref:Uncharacterized protein n=1 Tax=Crateriforma conspicua TaxID=2527996 RepID=A0A5C6FTX9_9PLAN|nr:hypothetical protein [Crateriforma conspicua]TWU66467.1 hypothetical protein V7x_20330 [Crateriforma conspicua]
MITKKLQAKLRFTERSEQLLPEIDLLIREHGQKATEAKKVVDELCAWRVFHSRPHVTEYRDFKLFRIDDGENLALLTRDSLHLIRQQRERLGDKW